MQLKIFCIMNAFLLLKIVLLKQFVLLTATTIFSEQAWAPKYIKRTRRGLPFGRTSRGSVWHILKHTHMSPSPLIFPRLKGWLFHPGRPVTSHDSFSIHTAQAAKSAGKSDDPASLLGVATEGREEGYKTAHSLLVSHLLSILVLLLLTLRWWQRFLRWRCDISGLDLFFYGSKSAFTKSTAMWVFPVR